MPRQMRATPDLSELARRTPREILRAAAFVAASSRHAVDEQARAWGWPSEVDRLTDFQRLVRLGVRIALNRIVLDDACLAPLDIEDSLRDWIGARRFVFLNGAQPTPEGLDRTVGPAAVEAWREYARQMAQQEEDAWELSQGLAESYAQHLAETKGAA